MLPGHGSIFHRLQRRRHTLSLSTHMSPLPPPAGGHRKCRNMRRCKDHNCGSCPSHPPVAMGWCGMNRGGIDAPSAIGLVQKKEKTMPVSSGSASALPGNIAGDWACFCAQSRSCPPPVSLLRLPGDFQCKVGTYVHIFVYACCPYTFSSRLESSIYATTAYYRPGLN